MLTLDLSANCKLDTKTSDLFLKICNDNRENFNDLIMNYSNKKRNGINWWVSSPASRNTLNSDLYLNFCKVQLVNHLLSIGELINEIIVDSKAMKNVLIQIPSLKYTNIILMKKGAIKCGIKKILIILIIPLRESLIRFLHLFLFRYFIKQNTNIPNHPITLIDTYVLPGFYSKDRYYNGLWGTLDTNEKKEVYFVPTIVMTKWNQMISVYKELINAERNFLFKEQYLKFTDIIYATFYPIRIQFINIKSIIIDDIDYSPLFIKDLRLEGGFDLPIEGLINYMFIKRLKKSNIKIKVAIDWWESQALDKGLQKGLYDFYGDVPVVGYLGYAPRNMELQLYPTKYELDNGVIPEIIAVIGKGFVDSLKVFNKGQKVVYAPAFRFQHLWNNCDLSPDKETYTILIALPITFDDSVHIIERMIACTNEKSIKTIRFWVKHHPTMPVKKIKRKFGEKWPQSFHFTDLDTQEAIRKANILVSGMSSITLEAMALGVPVLVIKQPSWLQYNPVPDNLEKDLWKLCGTREDIIEGVELYRKRDEAELTRHKELGLRIRETYFEPVTREGVLKFLGIEGEYNIAKS